MKKNEEVIKLRCKLLISLVKAWLVVSKISDLSDKETPGTLSHLQFQMKFLVPPTVLGKLVDEAVEKLGTGYAREVSVSRRKAMYFAEEGKVDHEGKYTMFGQIIKQLASQDSTKSNFR